MGDKKEKKGLLAEFKTFISRGSVVDLAVGVVIGGAFTAIVNSLVNDVIMPFIGWITGGISFTSLRIVIAQATADKEEVAICYGAFLQNVINFLVIAMVIFLVVKGINKMHRKKEEPAPAAPEPTKEEVLLTEIRDLLKDK